MTPWDPRYVPSCHIFTHFKIYELYIIALLSPLCNANYMIRLIRYIQLVNSLRLIWFSSMASAKRFNHVVYPSFLGGKINKSICTWAESRLGPNVSFMQFNNIYQIQLVWIFHSKSADTDSSVSLLPVSLKVRGPGVCCKKRWIDLW